jgi:predicted nucleic acid-binding protein
LGEPLPPLVNQTLTRHAQTLALADISLWEAARLVDPADQLIAATALVHGLLLISDDARIRQWGGVRLLWKTAGP